VHSGRASARIASLFQTTVVVLIRAILQGRLQSFYISYGSLFFALLYVAASGA
jgi:hypothetical protein